MGQYRIIIAGGRHFSAYEVFQRIVQKVFEKHGIQKEQAEIISGHCQGVDQLGERYAKENGILCTVFPAQWSKYGRSAGFRRNIGMVNYASEAEHSLVIAFWNGKSHGTGFTIQKAREKGIPVEEYLYQSPETDPETPVAQAEDKWCKGNETNKTISGSPVDPNYTFDRLVTGHSNQFAIAASLYVADNLGKEFNPLLIYGKCGVGKTSLLYAIKNCIDKNNPEKRVVYMTAEDFTNQIIKTIKEMGLHPGDVFRQKDHDVDVLLIDDIQFFLGKSLSTDYFINVVDDFYKNGKQIVLTSEYHPRHYENEKRLMNCLTKGLCVGIEESIQEEREKYCRDEEEK